MSVPKPVKYDLDYSGTNPNNLVTGETHNLDTLTNRIVVPNYGPFFTDDLVVVDTLTGRTLTPYTQYLAIQLEDEASDIAGKEICSIIIITDTKVSNTVRIQYQTLGGPLSFSVQAIIDLVTNLNLDNRPVAWGDIIGKPDRFPPTPHAHKLTDVVGWHKLFPELEAIARAILTSDQAVLDAIKEQFQSLIDAVNGDIANLNNTLAAHVNNKNNPHGTTKAHVGLPLVDNFATAVVGADTAAGNPANNKFTTPFIVASMIQAIAIAALNTHIADKGNPHGTTAAQVGAYTIAQMNALLLNKLDVTGTAANSNLFAGYDWVTAYTLMRSNLPASAVTSGIFNTARLGAGVANAQTVLSGTGWQDLKSMIDQVGGSFRIMYAGYVLNLSGGSELGGWSFALMEQTVINNVASIYADNNAYPVGTLVNALGSISASWGTGNGTAIRSFSARYLLQKTSSAGWSTAMREVLANYAQ